MADIPDLERQNILDRLHLSLHEIGELGVGWLVITFVLLYINGILDDLSLNNIPDQVWYFCFVAGVAFIGHELSHKFAAQRFGAWAEFKLDSRGLIITLASVIVGFPLIAPGAVFWRGNLARYHNIRGRVSAAGPLSNLLFASCFLLLSSLGDPFMKFMGDVGFTLNIWLGLFNLIPIGILDGAKVLDWDARIWITIVSMFFLLVIYRTLVI